MQDALCDFRLLARFGLGLLLVCLLLPGCGGEAKKSLERETSNLKPLALLYGQFIGQHRGQPPADEARFKQFVESLDSQQLGTFGLDSAAELWVSSRDGQPYVILYGNAAKTGPPGPAGAPVIAYEQVGVGGKRYVASSMGAIEEVDEARLKELVPAAK